ncbi:hypothetical protein EB809_05120 [Marinobacter sp. R17]|uniref:hypothetical protein n=1 Tax=Marinobacter sp. R17 TaxID=2484250 RepID=UPI000FA6A1FF|nr:hypothetical protein [Marinobacter sp. R17]ROU01473.1 hypothetical protein EB809_05120 [Marinobacter sp. R17]
MMVSGQAPYMPRRLVTRQDHAGEERESLKESISPRYRDGLGGIDLERVKRDQRRARREVFRALIRRLK